MSQSPLISVIVPVYNTEKYLRKCLDSICGQTYRNLEIICVNDGSPDNSAAILEEYAARDERIKVLTQQNAGQGAARNTGLDYASGEWITGVDSDDYLELDAYEYAINEATPDVDIVCFGTQVTWQNIPQQQHMDDFYAIPSKGIQYITSELIASTNDSFCNKIFRKNFIDNLGTRFPEGLWYEDSFFWRTTAPYARSVSYAPLKKYNYIRHDSSTMSQVFRKSKKTLDRVQVAELLMIFYTKHPLPSHLKQTHLDAFLFCFTCALSDAPKELHNQVWEGMRNIAEKYNLITSWPKQLHCLKRQSSIQRFFIRHHHPHKSSYGIPGFRPIVVQLKRGLKITRFLGIKISRKPI